LNFDTAERYGLKDVNDLYLKKGISLYNTGHLKESEKMLLHSLELQPTAEAQKYIGLIRYELRDYTGAIEPLKAASVDFQNDLQINFYLGMAYFITGRNAQSLTYFEKALEIEPDNPEIMFNTANLYMLNDRYEEAVGLYTGIQPESPYGEDSIYNCAEAYIKTGKYDSAAQLLRYLIGKNPHDYNARYNLAAALIKSEDYVSAVEILNDLQIINSTDARISYNLGLAYEGLGQTSLSLDFFKTAVTQDPRNPLYHYAYGLGLSENGDQEEAAVKMETVMKLDPDNINAGNWLENYRSSKIQSKQ
jgi:tetratricopeptide (TPR) repeat protein